jgi:hypothetical protein
MMCDKKPVGAHGQLNICVEALGSGEAATQLVRISTALAHELACRHGAFTDTREPASVVDLTSLLYGNQLAAHQTAPAALGSFPLEDDFPATTRAGCR